ESPKSESLNAQARSQLLLLLLKPIASPSLGRSFSRLSRPVDGTPPQHALHLPAMQPALRANDSLQTNQQVRAQTVIELTLRPPLIEGGRGNTANFTANLNSRRPK
ncbi:MAG: hypothetical protein AB8A32_08210, partial [Prochlorococcus sp.]